MRKAVLVVLVLLVVAGGWLLWGVDSVEPGQGDELADPGLVECVQQSILALTLPPPPQGGRDDFSLSLALTPEDGGATG